MYVFREIHYLVLVRYSMSTESFLSVLFLCKKWEYFDLSLGTLMSYIHITPLWPCPAPNNLTVRCIACPAFVIFIFCTKNAALTIEKFLAFRFLVSLCFVSKKLTREPRFFVNLYLYFKGIYYTRHEFLKLYTMFKRSLQIGFKF